ncbi:hypothetical protein AN478_02270 [Thiohalorhabdus denitrificans]|uniref:Uncharacterized protein n=1 Tax=Thiohalorhabdus denitrificans TaxID=381306 RepID=A0A0P9CQD5_9GAMM|nr:hypothetical protein [Thiohalorhabdus denitrificans]KPV41423.1 hypothetical protein AN478_02270 [Thiohalorhabdus denitrificans]SCY26836.1 hypothetical protein SAMN05661077_1647 [Thiohalorhabdus denitrificans]
MRKLTVLMLCGMLAPSFALAGESDCAVSGIGETDAVQVKCDKTNITNAGGNELLRNSFQATASPGVKVQMGVGSALSNDIVVSAAHQGGTKAFGASTAQSSVQEYDYNPQDVGADSAASSAWSDADAT